MKKPTKSRQTTRNGISIGGNVDTGGGDITGRDHIEIHVGGTEPVAQAFAPIYEHIDARKDLSPTDKGDLKAATQEIQAEALKGKKANSDLVQRRLREVGRMAPDILEVILATLANPVVGLGLVAQKVAHKAAEDPAASPKVVK